MFKRIRRWIERKADEKTYNYAQLQGKRHIDWISQITSHKLKAWPRIPFKKLVDYAGDWDTCATGQLTNLIPRSPNGVPYDEKLREYGWEFCVAINQKDWDRAIGLRNKITYRSWQMTGVSEV